MKQIFVKDLRKDDGIVDFFLVKAVGVKMGSNRKNYLDILLADKTGEVNSKKWDVSDAEIPALNSLKEGDIVKVKALVTDWQNQTQLRIMRIRKADERDGLDIMDFVKAAPERPEDMYAYIHQVADGMRDQDLRRLCLRVLEDNHEKLMYYRRHPAITMLNMAGFCII